MMDKEREAAKSLHFLNGHPALYDAFHGTFLGTNAIYPSMCSKYGYTEDEPIAYYSGDPEFNQYIEFKEPDDDAIYLTHLQRFGTKWEFDHVRWWYDVTLNFYVGPFAEGTNYYDPKWWTQYGTSLRGWAPTFNDLLIDCSSKVGTLLGCWDMDKDFRTPNEIENHKIHMPWISKEISEPIDKEYNPEGEQLFSMLDNPNYIDVTPAMVSRRWLRWFNDTPKCREYYEDTFDLHIKNTPDWVWGK